MSLEEISNMFGWSSIAGRAVSEWFHYRLLVYITTKRKGRPHGTHTMCEWLNALTHPVQIEWRVKCSVVLATKVAANKGISCDLVKNKMSKISQQTRMIAKQKKNTQDSGASNQSSLGQVVIWYLKSWTLQLNLINTLKIILIYLFTGIVFCNLDAWQYSNQTISITLVFTAGSLWLQV